MPYIVSNGTSVPHASSHDDFLTKLIAYLCGVGVPTFSGTGGVRPRYVRALSSAVAETWTLTCTNGAAGTFSVSGSVSGAQAAATVGTPYTAASKVSFTLSNVSGLAVTGDVITFTTNASNVVTAGNAWQLIRYDAVGTGNNRAFLCGLGTSGTDQIFVGLESYQNVGSDYYNIKLSGGTGYTESQNSLNTMPGSSYNSYVTEVCLLSGTMPYWIIANGRRFMFVVKVSTVYESAYCGLILPTGTTSEYSYPLAIGGSHSANARRYSDNLASGNYGSFHRAFFNPNNSLVIRQKGGTWLPIANYYYSGAESANSSPYTSQSCTAPFRDVTLARTIDNSFVLFPVTIHTSTPSIEVLGDLEGVYMVSGISNVSENLVTISSVDHLVVQNTFRTDIGEYAALKLA